MSPTGDGPGAVYENREVPKEIIELLKKHRRRPNEYIVTRLICCPRRTFFRMEGVPEVIRDETQLIFARGRAHHGILQVYKATEVEVNKLARCGKNIHGDIDMIGDRITEIFTTMISSKRIPEDRPEEATKVFPQKIDQLKAYSYMKEKTEGDLLVFFLFGDYSRFTEVYGKKYYKGIIPELRCFTYNFSKIELEEVWEKMNCNLEDIEEGRRTGQPPLTVGEKWECKNCGYWELCFGEEAVGESQELSVFTEPISGDIL